MLGAVIADQWQFGITERVLGLGAVLCSALSKQRLPANLQNIIFCLLNTVFKFSCAYFKSKRATKALLVRFSGADPDEG